MNSIPTLSKEIPLMASEPSHIVVVTHKETTCLTVSIGRGRGKSISGLYLSDVGRASLRDALMGWQYFDDGDSRLPDEGELVMVAIRERTGELALEYASLENGRWNYAGVQDLTGKIYAWAPIPAAPRWRAQS